MVLKCIPGKRPGETVSHISPLKVQVQPDGLARRGRLKLTAVAAPVAVRNLLTSWLAAAAAAAPAATPGAGEGLSAGRLLFSAPVPGALVVASPAVPASASTSGWRR